LVQAFLKKWWVESDFKAPNLIHVVNEYSINVLYIEYDNFSRIHIKRYDMVYYRFFPTYYINLLYNNIITYTISKSNLSKLTTGLKVEYLGINIIFLMKFNSH
jgi:hypothetical protein